MTGGGIAHLLAFDAAGGGCAAAVWSNGKVVARRGEAMRRGQAERLVPMIDSVMAEAGLRYGDLDAVAVTTGPGGFTGVRLGLATARGLALALGVPVIGVTSLQALAAAVPEREREGRTLVVLIDAKRRDLYVQAFDSALKPLHDPAALPPEALDGHLPAGALLLAGDAVEQARPALEQAGRHCTVSSGPPLADAGVIAELAVSAGRPGPDAPVPRPLYLRAPDVTMPSKPGTGQGARAK